MDVRAGLAGEFVEIEVEDSGVGIDPEFLPYVFDRFRQADGRATRLHGGLGLGLAIARHLVERHGGDIRASSAGPGQGTVVLVRIPAGARLPHESAPVPQDRTPIDMDLWLDGTTVVVVDDQRDSRELLSALFAGCGAQVVECDSAASALAHLRLSAAHLLVADIAMPGVDGIELIRRVRKLRHQLPAVAVSAYDRPEDRDKALASGYRAYCTKPIDHRQLLQTVRHVLAPPQPSRSTLVAES